MFMFLFENAYKDAYANVNKKEFPPNSLDPQVFYFTDEGNDPVLLPGIAEQIKNDIENINHAESAFMQTRVWNYVLTGPILDKDSSETCPIVIRLQINKANLDDVTKERILQKIKEKSTVFSSDWLLQAKRPVPNWVKVYDRTTKYNFPDSITTGMQLFSRHIVERHRCSFYIAGVSLTWQEPSHFWKVLDHPSTNRHGDSGYSPRFERMNHNFKQLKNTGFEMISVNPNSLLNKMMRYENIENLYKKS